MAPPSCRRLPVLAAFALAAARLASAQFSVDDNANFGDGPFPSGSPLSVTSSDSNGSGLDDSSTKSSGLRPRPTQSSDDGAGFEDAGSSVTSTETTKNLMGGPLTLVHTYPVILGTEIVRTTDLLGQSTTLYIPLDTTATPTASSGSADLGPQSTYTSTDASDRAHTIFGPASILPTATSSQPTGELTSTASGSDTTAPPDAGAAVSPSSTLTEASTDNSSSRMSHGAIAAAVVVPIVVVVALLALAFFILRRRRRNRNAARSHELAGDESGPGMQERQRGFESTPAGGHGAAVTGAGAAVAGGAAAVAAKEHRQSQGDARPDSDTTAPPAIVGSPESWRNENEQPLGSSYSSTGSDPFKDPSLASPDAYNTNTPPVPAVIPEHTSPPPAESMTRGFSTPPEAPSSPQPQHLGVPDDGVVSEATTPVDERTETMRTLSPASELDDAEIMEGQVATVGTAQRASMIQMRGRRSGSG
ncbi:MAG: hypothetical protein Q9159_002976 [Coniocarpon cinnabarinum]